MAFLSISVLILACAYQGYGYPEGAPTWTCPDGYPHHHGADAETGTPPFEIVPSKTTYSPNERITLILRGKNNEEFEGFLIRVQRTQGDTEQCVGSFPDTQNNVLQLNYHAEAPAEPNCLTHSDEVAWKELTVVWVAPAQTVGEVKVKATVLEGFTTFWTNVEVTLSPTVTTNVDLGQSIQPATSFADFDFATCGLTKGCALYPDGCDGYDCRYGVSWSPDPDDATRVLFELFVDTDDEYISIGFSTDEEMGDDDTNHCVATEDATPIFSVQHGNTDEEYNYRHRIKGYNKLSVKRSDGLVFCSFSRPLSVSYYIYNEDDQEVGVTFDLTAEEFYLFFATGPVFLNSDATGKHKQLPLVSKEKINFEDNTGIYEFYAIPLHLKIHGSLGLISWATMAAIGMFISRHYRSTLAGKCCGTGTWFQLHRGIMITTVVVSAAAIAVIFGYLQEWTHSAVIHAILGLISMALSILMVIAGLARPGLESKNRNTFNWAHRIGGIVTFLVAAVCVILGLTNVLIDREVAKYEAIIIGVWFGFYLLMEIILEIIKYCASDDVEKSGEKSTKRVLLVMVLVFVMLCSVCLLGAAITFLVRA